MFSRENSDGGGWKWPSLEKKNCNLVILKMDVSGSRNEHILLV